MPTTLQCTDDVTRLPLAGLGVRVRAVADELKLVMRLAGRRPEALEHALGCLSQFARVTAAAELDEPTRVHFIVHRLIPEYLERLPVGRDCRAIRELLAWEDADGEPQSLTTRYHKAAAHLVGAASDFGRRQEPRLLRECARRFIALDHEDRLAAVAARPRCRDHRRSRRARDLRGRSQAPAHDEPSGIVRVHRNVDHHLLVDHIAEAQEVTILNTWIPGLDILADALLDALARGARPSRFCCSIPTRTSHTCAARAAAAAPGPFRDGRVRPGVRRCLDILAAIEEALDADHRGNLRVRLYDALPSISVFAVDERAFLSFLLHGQLAVKSAQIEVLGRDTVLGRLVEREIDVLWRIGSPVEQRTASVDAPRRAVRIPG